MLALSLLRKNDLVKQSSHWIEKDHHDCENDAAHRKRNKRQVPLDCQHHWNQPEKRHAIEKCSEELPGQKVTNLPDLCEVCDDASRWRTFEILHRKFEHLVHNVQAKATVYARRHYLRQYTT